MKKRLDTLLVEKGFAESRARAQLLIRAGKVKLPYAMPAKPSVLVSEREEITLVEDYPFVSRAGEKLECFLREAGDISLANQIVLDVGASTGGFTQVALSRGAKRVYALDVGRRLLHPKLSSDPRVVVLDKVNFRYVTKDLLQEKVDTVLMDASFISLSMLLPKVPIFLKDGGALIALVKPQFEVGPERVSRGIVTQSLYVAEAVAKIRLVLIKLNFQVLREAKSAVKGKKGNQEVFLMAKMMKGKRS